MGIVFQAENLVKDYKLSGDKEDERVVHVLRGLNFQIEENEFVGFMGKSGCGKTTLLKILGLIEDCTGGKIYFEDDPVSDLPEMQMAAIRRQRIGFVFQDYYLVNSLSVEENIVLPMLLNKAKALDCLKRARYFERILGIQSLAKKRPYVLSGGEKQRVAICRALINNPNVILADEPTGNLDSKASEILITLFENIHQNLGKTIVMVSHDPQIASHCSRVIFLKDGLVMNDLKRGGSKEDFYKEILNQMKDL